MSDKALKVLVVGATGRTGTHLVQQALDAGYTVTAMARRPSAVTLSSPRLRVVEGDVLQPATLEAAVAGQDLVISTLGAVDNRATPGASTPLDVVSVGTRNLVEAMKRQQVKRLVVMSSGGARMVEGSGGGRKVISAILAVASSIKRTDLEELFLDKLRMEAAVKASGLDWTIVRPAILTDGPRRARYVVGKQRGRIARADVAEFILQRAESARGQTVHLAN